MLGGDRERGKHRCVVVGFGLQVCQRSARQGRVRLPVTLRRSIGGMTRDAARAGGAVNQAGVMTNNDRAPCPGPTCSRGPSGERANLAVAQAVVDQGEQSAGGDHPDVAAPGYP